MRMPPFLNNDDVILYGSLIMGHSVQCQEKATQPGDKIKIAAAKILRSPPP